MREYALPQRAGSILANPAPLLSHAYCLKHPQRMHNRSASRQYGNAHRLRTSFCDDITE
jgi:hypothetical protein